MENIFLNFLKCQAVYLNRFGLIYLDTFRSCRSVTVSAVLTLKQSRRQSARPRQDIQFILHSIYITKHFSSLPAFLWLPVNLEFLYHLGLLVGPSTTTTTVFIFLSQDTANYQKSNILQALGLQLTVIFIIDDSIGWKPQRDSVCKDIKQRKSSLCKC